MTKRKADMFADSVTALLGEPDDTDARTRLQRLIQNRYAELKSEGYSWRDLADRSSGGISTAWLHRLARQHLPQGISPETIDGLALALDLPRSSVAAAAKESEGHKPPPAFRLPPRSGMLNDDNRRMIEALADRLLDQQLLADRSTAALERIYDAARTLRMDQVDTLGQLLWQLAHSDPNDPDALEGVRLLVDELVRVPEPAREQYAMAARRSKRPRRKK